MTTTTLPKYYNFDDAEKAADRFFNLNFESCTRGASINFKRIAVDGQEVIEYHSVDDPGMEDTFRCIVDTRPIKEILLENVGQYCDVVTKEGVEVSGVIESRQGDVWIANGPKKELSLPSEWIAKIENIENL